MAVCYTSLAGLAASTVVAGPWDIPAVCFTCYCCCYPTQSEGASGSGFGGLGPYDPNDARDLFVCQAEFAEPEGVLDLADITGFMAAFAEQLPHADLAHPAGVFDLADLGFFLDTHSAGCTSPELYDSHDLWSLGGGTYIPENSVVLVGVDDSTGMVPLLLLTLNQATNEFEVDAEGTLLLVAGYTDAGSSPSQIALQTNSQDGFVDATVESVPGTIAGWVQFGADDPVLLMGSLDRINVSMTVDGNPFEYSIGLFDPMHELQGEALATQFAELYTSQDPLSNGVIPRGGQSQACQAAYDLCIASSSLQYRTDLDVCKNWLGNCLLGCTAGGATGCAVGALVCLIPGVNVPCCAIGVVTGCISGCYAAGSGREERVHA